MGHQPNGVADLRAALRVGQALTAKRPERILPVIARVWQIFRALAIELRKREIDPTPSMLCGALTETPSGEEGRVASKRMR